MVKKATRLDKDNRHPCSGETVYFGTKHDKASALAPLFLEIGMRCESIDVDTDEFGTFTGEIERNGSVKDTLRKKVEAVLRVKPDARFVVASEGSFGPHPFVGFIQSDHEVLLFFDRSSGLEIFAEELSTETNHDQIEFGPQDDLKAFLKRVHFPSHGIIVRPKGVSSTVFKGLTTWHGVGQAIIDCFLVSSEPKVILSTDMRASFNPTRMSVIAQAGKKLIQRLTSFCPACSMIGFGAIRGVPGLQCSSCMLSTQISKAVVHGCVSCSFEQVREREDGLKFADPAECDFCNP